jgi:branched-chain amino acid transport system ATP-binding protein
MSTDMGKTGTAVLEARDVAVHYGGVKAVDGLSLSLEAGKISGIIGPNGSGKSTLIAALTLLTPLTRGELVFDGETFHGTRASHVARRGIARTFQTVRLLPDLTVKENIQLGADVHGAEAGSRWRLRRAAAAGASEAIERTGLHGLDDVYPGELSYGTQRRVEIARAIAMRPKLLLLDEPTAGMNQQERSEITLLMKELCAEGLTQLLVEHDVQMMLETCDHMIAMNSGRVIAEGDPAEVVRNSSVQEAYLGRKWKDHA